MRRVAACPAGTGELDRCFAKKIRDISILLGDIKVDLTIGRQSVTLISCDGAGRRPMTLTWDISFLLDPQGKIEEARGNSLEILGEPVRAMVGRSFLPFIANADRAHFRRFLGQLGNTNAVRRAMLHLRTANHGDKPFFMEAQNGWSAERHWILLAVPKDQVGAHPLAVLDAPVPAGSDDDLLMLIEMATAEIDVPVDLTVFNVGALATPAAVAKQGTALTDKLRNQVEQTLTAAALDGVVTRSAPGVYNVLHESSVAAGRIADEVQAEAEAIGISAEQLGLKRHTENLGLHPTRERIQQAVTAVKQPIQDRSLPVGMVEEERKAGINWFLMTLGALGLILLGVAIVTVVELM